MPSRKAEKIVRTLRDEILSGQRAPGEKLPTYDALIEQFRITRPPVARVLRALRIGGLIEVSGPRVTFCAASFPHHRRNLWGTSDPPCPLDCTTISPTAPPPIQRNAPR